MGLSIESVSASLPGTILDVSEDHERLGIPSAMARVFARMYALPRCPVSDVPEADLLLRAARETLERAGCAPDRVTCLIHAHTGAVIGAFGRSIPLFLARSLGLDRAVAFGTCSNNCIAVFTALRLAGRLLGAEAPGSRALVVVGEVADNLELRVVQNVAIVGDAAAAALLGTDGETDRLLASAVHTHPGYAAGIWLPPDAPASREFEALYQQRLRAVIDEALETARVRLEDIAWIIPHNVNVWMWRRAAQFMNFPIERVFLENTQRTAHCLGADMFLNLESLIRLDRLRRGDLYLMASAGVGGVMGAAVFRH